MHLLTLDICVSRCTSYPNSVTESMLSELAFSPSSPPALMVAPPVDRMELNGKGLSEEAFKALLPPPELCAKFISIIKLLCRKKAGVCSIYLVLYHVHYRIQGGVLGSEDPPPPHAPLIGPKAGPPLAWRHSGLDPSLSKILEGVSLRATGRLAGRRTIDPCYLSIVEWSVAGRTVRPCWSPLHWAVMCNYRVPTTIITPLRNYGIKGDPL